MQRTTTDIRKIIFRNVAHKILIGQVIVQQSGIIAGVNFARDKLAELEIEPNWQVENGFPVKEGDCIVRLQGTPLMLSRAEEVTIGCLAKASGIATASHRAMEQAAGRIKIVCGAWKKMPLDIKGLVREAVYIGGASIRICDQPFIYLDKNYVRIFGGIEQTLKEVLPLKDYIKVIQVRGETNSVNEETRQAINGGASIVMVDTGQEEDARAALRTLEELGIRDKTQVAFAGGIEIEQIPMLAELGIDILDIGSRIIDAPLLDMKMDIVNLKRMSCGS